MGTPLSTFIHDYLSNRHHFERVLGDLSRPSVNLSGVPQGSILRSLLFNAFVNNLSSCIRHLEILQYVGNINTSYFGLSY